MFLISLCRVPTVVPPRVLRFTHPAPTNTGTYVSYILHTSPPAAVIDDGASGRGD